MGDRTADEDADDARWMETGKKIVAQCSGDSSSATVLLRYYHLLIETADRRPEEEKEWQINEKEKI